MAVSELRYCAQVEYDGANFLGYQLQAQGRTVQGEIEQALFRVTHTDYRVDAAGRTDTGVHATGQVVAFNAVWKHTLADLHRAINANLPPDIIFSQLKTVDRAFHPRFDAISRSYQYTILNQPWPSVLWRGYACHIRQNLNVTAMRQASRLLLGSHNFASFGKPPQGNNPVRHVMQADWTETGPRLVFEITANAFLYRMVRNIVGTLVQVGLGQLAPEDINTILAAHDLSRSSSAAPAHGLCLVRVTYPEDA